MRVHLHRFAIRWRRPEGPRPWWPAAAGCGRGRVQRGSSSKGASSSTRTTSAGAQPLGLAAFDAVLLRTELPKRVAPIPSSLATTHAIGLPVSRTIRTSPSRNSASNRRLHLRHGICRMGDASTERGMLGVMHFLDGRPSPVACKVRSGARASPRHEVHSMVRISQRQRSHAGEASSNRRCRTEAVVRPRPTAAQLRP